MLMSREGLLRENSKPSLEEIKVGVSGNLCRCTGYPKIIRAIESVFQKKGGIYCIRRKIVPISAFLKESGGSRPHIIIFG